MRRVFTSTGFTSTRDLGTLCDRLRSEENHFGEKGGGALTEFLRRWKNLCPKESLNYWDWEFEERDDFHWQGERCHGVWGLHTTGVHVSQKSRSRLARGSFRFVSCLCGAREDLYWPPISMAENAPSN